MRIEDLLGDLTAAQKLREAARSPLHDTHAKFSLAARTLTSPVQQMIDRMARDDRLRLSMFGDTGMLAVARDAARAVAEQERLRGLLAHSSIVEETRRVAEIVRQAQLSNALISYRFPVDDLIWRNPLNLSVFQEASAIGSLFAENARVTRTIAEANRAMMLGPTGIISLPDYRALLDAAGLHLPRWPRVRLLSKAEKRRRFREKLSDNVESLSVRRAKSLVHRYELTLRDVLDAVMAEFYGENWPHERLPLCGCKDLLGKWLRRGGAVLDHADYAHYARIVSNPDHYTTIFQSGFDDAGEAHDLFVAAGRLRAASHHAKVFTPEDLRDLRLTWRTIEKGLVALDNDYAVEW